MIRLRALVGWLGAVVLCVAAAAHAEDDAPSADPYHLKRVPFEELSDRNVSRQGEAALKLPDVKWEHSETDHFVFHTEAGFAVAQLAGAAEWSYAEIKKDFDITQDLFERKCHVYVFLNEQAWREFVGAGKLEPWTGGWCTGRELFFWSRPHFKFQGTTLPHELTHLVLYRFVGGDIPLWLNEGLAEFEGIRLYRTYLKTRGYILTNVRDHLDRSQYIPLDDLTSAVDYPRETDQVVAFYTESQRLVSFLYYQHGGIGPLIRFLKLQSQGSRFDSAWREIYSSKYTDQQAFEDKFIAYITKAKE
ncbi:MAG TPA: hypothetical protein VL486_11260 [Verrucomicrobiae bacterium]|nr:hypothetical protein [Verrucomicrobiae bacterium]